MNINYLGSVYMTKTCSYVEGRQCTHIGVNTSISGLFGFPQVAYWPLQKSLYSAFSESLDLENDNIKVTFIIPGRVNTQISKSAILADGSRYAKMDQARQTEWMSIFAEKPAVRAVAKGKHRKLIDELNC